MLFPYNVASPEIIHKQASEEFASLSLPEILDGPGVLIDLLRYNHLPYSCRIASCIAYQEHFLVLSGPAKKRGRQYM